METLIKLYRFVEGDGTIWTVTSSDAEQTHDAETYAPVTIGGSETEVKNELSRANLQITVDLDNEMGRKWMSTSLERNVSLTVFDRTDVETLVSWKGRLTGVKLGLSDIVLVFESIFTSLRRPGLRARYHRACRHVLYGRGCTLDKEDFAILLEVTAVAEEQITVPGAADVDQLYFMGGMIEGPDEALRFITDHNGEFLTLIRPMSSLEQGLADSGYGINYGDYYGSFGCRLFPGCPRDRFTCDDRFDNLENFGGFPFIPVRNPFDGNSIV